jgi:hypothetical protein
MLSTRRQRAREAEVALNMRSSNNANRAREVRSRHDYNEID